jgi:hypothetical protein
MSDRKINTGGLENLMDVAVRNKNVPLCLKLADILVAEGGKISKKQFKKLLGLAKRVTDNKDAKDIVLACVRLGAGCGHLGSEVLKRGVFPHVDNTWPELTVAQLEDQGLGRAHTVTPLIEFLVGQGKAEAAATVAAIFPEHVDARLKFLNAATAASPSSSGAGDGVSSTQAGDSAAKAESLLSTPSSSPDPTSSSPVPSHSKTDETLACLVKQMVEDDKIQDLGRVQFTETLQWCGSVIFL